MQTILRSSYADITVERETGAVITIDYAAMGGTNEWDDVARFDPETLSGDEMDVLDAGFWTKGGEHVPPC